MRSPLLLLGLIVVAAAILVSYTQAALFDTILNTLPTAISDLILPRIDKPTFVKHLNNVTVVDHMKAGLPKVRLGHRVVDLFSGWHFDDILMDAPDSVRPPSVVAFYDSSDSVCMRKYNALNFDSVAERELPSRSRLFAARYDMYSAPRRPWYEFTPEMDLAKRFNVEQCPQVVFVSRKCDGFTDWCEQGPDKEDPRLQVLGCEDFTEHCTEDLRQTWDGSGKLSDWINENIKSEGVPQLSRFLGSYFEQGRWLQKREHTTCGTHFRNIYLSQAFPAFTHRGFKVIDTPAEVQTWLLQFVKSYERYRKTEFWNAESTQMSFHEKPTTFIDMDRVRAKKNQVANEILKPLVEEWSGMSPLELTSFYGMREYHEGAWLRQHVDRIDTHVLSITLSVAKKNFTFDPQGEFPYKPWPLRVTDWTGKQIAYDHPAGTMILYESSKLPHGRPTRNEGGIHLGCFVHYKPMQMHGSDAKVWDDITNKARKNQRDHTETARYRAATEVEPSAEQLVYAETNVGEGSSWSKVGDKSKPDKSGSFGVKFKNGSDRQLRVFWYSGSVGSAVEQGSAGPGSMFDITTYHGHTFFWADMQSEKPLQGGKFTVDIGKKLYEYNINRDGTVQK